MPTATGTEIPSFSCTFIEKYLWRRIGCPDDQDTHNWHRAPLAPYGVLVRFKLNIFIELLFRLLEAWSDRRLVSFVETQGFNEALNLARVGLILQAWAYVLACPELVSLFDL